MEDYSLVLRLADAGEGAFHFLRSESGPGNVPHCCHGGVPRFAPGGFFRVGGRFRADADVGVIGELSEGAFLRGLDEEGGFIFG